MPRRSLVLITGATTMIATAVHATDPAGLHTGNAPGAEAMVDALDTTFGRHAGQRASHPKGICAVGRFEPSPNASSHFNTRLFTSGALSAKVRFSIAGGNPKVSDKAPAARGLAFTLALPNQEQLTLVMISTPTFFAATRESFIDFLAARKPDPATGKPDPRLLEASNANHLDSEAQRRWLAAVPPSASYATAPYFAAHTYYFNRAEGPAQPARWQLEPESGRLGLSADELATKPDHYLFDELGQRLAKAPAAWRVSLVLPEATDPLLNPTIAWPDTRRSIDVGRLIVTSIASGDAAADCNTHVFDPTHLPTGILPPKDAMFAIRAEAYAVSASRRAE